MSIVELIFENRINTFTLSVEEPVGTAKPWAGVDHMVLHLIDKAELLGNQTIDPAPVNFSTDGVLIFTLGDQSIPVGKWKVQLTAVAAGGNKTQVIHYQRDGVVFTLIDTETIS